MHSVVDGLQNNGAIVEDVLWLAPNEACDIYFAVLGLEEARELMKHMLASVPFDAVVQPVYGRKKKLLISDMDSTIIQQECIDEIAEFAGIKPKIAAITERAMNGELDFKAALRERVALLKGIPEGQLQEAYDTRIKLMPGAKSLVLTMKANGARCVLVSGGFTFFTQRIQKAVGFDVQEANVLGITDGKLDGTVEEPILDSTAKSNALLFHAEDFGVTPAQVLAVGDGANDLPMIKQAGLGVAYHAKPAVKAEAHVAINYCDLTALLYAQGYKAEEIVNR